MEVLCKHCGIGFVPKVKGQIYCSNACVGKYKAGLLCPKHNLKRTKWGHCPQCKRDNGRKWIQGWRKTPEGKLKEGARTSVYVAVRDGKLVRQPCIVCNNPKTQAHHLFGYNEENWLRVVFLCQEHHILADNDSEFNEKLKKEVRSAAYL